MSSPDASNAAVGGAPANNPLSSLGSTLASLSSLTALAGSGTPPPSHPPSAPPATGVPNAASDLIKSLMQAGLLPGSQAAAPVEEDQDADYVKDIMALDIKATSADLQRCV